VIRLKLRSSIQSLVPLLHRRLGSAQAAVDHTTQILIENVAGFEEIAERLLASHIVPEADGNTQLHDFVEGCRFYCSGNLVWRYEYPVPKRKIHFPTLCLLISRLHSLKTQRYGIDCEDMSRGVGFCLG